MISYLHYLTASKPDIYLNIHMCAPLQSDSIETLLTYGKRILMSLKGYTNPDLMYKKHQSISFQVCMMLPETELEGNAILEIIYSEAECVSASIYSNQKLWLKHEQENDQTYESNNSFSHYISLLNISAILSCIYIKTLFKKGLNMNAFNHFLKD